MKCPVSKREGEKEEEGRADDDDDPAPRARRPRALFLSRSKYSYRRQCDCQPMYRYAVQEDKAIRGGAEYFYSPRGGARRTPSGLHTHTSVHIIQPGGAQNTPGR